jgi:hypothetical protein
MSTDFKNRFLPAAVVAQEKKLAEEREAGMCPAEFGAEENAFPALPFTEIVSGEGQIKRVRQCPQCALEGRDKFGRHLVDYPGGRFVCIRFEQSAIEGPERTEHLGKVWKLAGGKKSGLKRPAAMPAAIKEKRLAMMATAKKTWKEAREKYALSMEDWLKMSADLPGSPEDDFYYAASLSKPGQLQWFGHRYECAAVFPTHLYEPAKDARRAWEHVDYRGLDHTFGFMFKPGADSRGKDNRAGQLFDVIEHDDEGLEGQIALTRYLQSMGLRLLLCLDTTNRGFHSWFDAASISPDRRQMIAFLLEAIGGDKGAFMRASTRTPGAVRQNQYDGKPYGNRQRIIFIPKNS